ncbi:MAG: AMIN domain-containing protein, partial [Methylotetracoccus sp.]|nr:AMIN domain-containing protein [Methylotetracoccus sp.]
MHRALMSNRHRAGMSCSLGEACRARARSMTAAAFVIADRLSSLLRSALLFGLCLLVTLDARGEVVSLKSIDFGTTSGGSLRFEITFDGPVIQPRMFQTDNPARIAIDFPGVSNGLTQKNIPVRLRGA